MNPTRARIFANRAADLRRLAATLPPALALTYRRRAAELELAAAIFGPPEAEPATRRRLVAA